MRFTSLGVRLLAVAALIFAPASLFAEEGSGVYTAEVLEVGAGNAMKFRVDDHTEGAFLYGVECEGISSTKGAKAKAYAEEQIGDDTVELEVSRRIAGVAYVTVTLPDGRILNQLLLENGMGTWDRLSAPDSDDCKAWAAVWDEKQRVEGDAEAERQAEEDAVVPLLTNTSEEYLKQKDLEAQAGFEVALYLWGLLSDEEREAIRERKMVSLENLIYDVEVVQEEFNQNISDIERERYALGEASMNHFNEMEGINSLADSKMSQIYRDAERNAPDRPGSDYLDFSRIRTNDRRVVRALSVQADRSAQYYYQRTWDRADEQARNISDARANAIAPHEAALAEIDERGHFVELEAASLDHRQSLYVNRARRIGTRLLADIGLITAMDGARADGYEIGLLYPDVERWDDKGSKTSDPFVIDSNAWILAWEPTWGEAKVYRYNVDVYNAENDRLVGRVGSRTEWFKSFHTFEGPGEFYLKFTPNTDSEYSCLVLEVVRPIE